MAKNETKRLSPAKINFNKNAIANLKQIRDFKPGKPDYSTGNGEAFLELMTEMQKLASVAEKSLMTARDNVNEAEWKLHNYVLGLKAQIISQYGEDSNELQSLGWKKKSEYKKRTVKAKKV